MVPILFQNSEFIAVEKPEGISVHNVEDSENLILVLTQQLKGKKLFPVHRLDKETSGIQILAFDSEAAARLAAEFQEKSVVKIYRGIVRGAVAGETVWNRPLSDKAEGRKNPEGLAKDRVPCETRVRVLRANQYFSDCEIRLITGRQHQIRKHSVVARHGLVGDHRYGDPKYNAKMAEIYGSDRLFLHCSRLEIAGQVITSSPPEIFNKLFQ